MIGSLTTYTVEYGSAIPALPARLTHGINPYMDFQGWYTQREGQGIFVADVNGITQTYLNAEMVATSTAENVIHIYTHFKLKEYDVMFYGGDGTTVLGVKKVAHGTLLSDLSISYPDDGKTAVEWALQLGGTPFAGKVESAMTLYPASYVIKVAFDANGGSDSTTVTKKEGESINSLPSVNRKGYSFVGWYFQDDTEVSVPYTPTKDTTVYAHWAAHQYTITFDLNCADATISSDSMTVEYNSHIQLPVPTRPNYEFTGWRYDYSGGTVLVGFSNGLVSQWDLTGNITLKAQWEPAYVEFVLN